MAFTNPLTYANIVSAQQFELLDALGNVSVYWLGQTAGGVLLGSGAVGERAIINISGDAVTADVGMSVGDTTADSAYVTLTNFIGTGTLLTLRTTNGGVTASELTLGSTGLFDVTTTIGVTLNSRPTRQNIAFGEAASTANLALGAADVAIPGATVTHTLNAGDLVVVTGYYDLGNAGATSTAWGTLYVNGALAFGGRGPGHTIGAGGRSTVSHQWQYTAPSAGAYTFVLRGRQTAGTWTAYQPFGAGGCYISTAVYATV